MRSIFLLFHGLRLLPLRLHPVLPRLKDGDTLGGDLFVYRNVVNGRTTSKHDRTSEAAL